MSSTSTKHPCSTATVKRISLNAVRKQTKKTEGLVLQGCEGEPIEWIGHINELFTQEGILLDGFVFKPEDCAVFVNDDVICIYFDIYKKPIDIWKLAAWRGMTRFVYYGVWLSDYVRNYLT